MSKEQCDLIMSTDVHQALLMYIHTPLPLFLPESAVLSALYTERPASSIAASGTALSSQVSVITITQLLRRCEIILSLISSILFTSDRAFVRKRLGSAGLCGLACSLARTPALFPRFCFRSLRRLRRLTGGMMSVPLSSS